MRKFNQEYFFKDILHTRNRGKTKEDSVAKLLSRLFRQLLFLCNKHSTISKIPLL